MITHPSLIYSNKILALVRKVLPKKASDDCILKVWANGQMQGYSITRNHDDYKKMKKVVFARHAVYYQKAIVYGGHVDSFDNVTNAPLPSNTVEIYRGIFGSPKDAAKAIVEALVKK